jgi:hypothetical protein
MFLIGEWGCPDFRIIVLNKFEPGLEAIQEMKDKQKLTPSSSDGQATLQPPSGLSGAISTLHANWA